MTKMKNNSQIFVWFTKKDSVALDAGLSTTTCFLACDCLLIVLSIMNDLLNAKRSTSHMKLEGICLASAVKRSKLAS